jgi:hypothetical protein
MANNGVARRDAVCNLALQAIASVLSQRGTTVAAVHVPTLENYLTDTGTRFDPAEFATFLQRTYPGVAAWPVPSYSLASRRSRTAWRAELVQNLTPLRSI